jgi:hypothetical protein
MRLQLMRRVSFRYPCFKKESRWLSLNLNTHSLQRVCKQRSANPLCTCIYVQDAALRLQSIEA